jgi:hypothetical protein
MWKPLSSSVLAITVALFAHAEAWAISNGVPDGSGHPAVGALYVDFDGSGTITGDELLCSGAYVGRTKDNGYDAFLTAGHCVEFALGSGITQMYVSFDTLAFDPDGPTGIIPSVAFFLDPNFGHDSGNAYDFGIVLLPAGSVVGIQPVQFPKAGFLDAYRHGAAIKSLDVESVGYGDVPIFNEPHGPQVTFAGIRRVVRTNIKGLTKSWVLYNENYVATGGGGTCFGDSGSPQYIAGTHEVISITSQGDPLCRATEMNTRLDTSYARQFYGQFIDLP